MNPQKKLLACVVALTTFVCTFGQITIVDDAMTGTNNAAGRQAAPSSTRVQWFMGGNYSSTYGSGSLNVTNASAQVLGYFTAAGSPVQLAVGETLTATFTFKMTGLPGGTTADGQLRFGLLNSDTGTNSPNRISADVFSANNQFLGYTGYAAMMRVNANATGNLALFERTNMTNLDRQQCSLHLPRFHGVSGFGQQYFLYRNLFRHPHRSLGSDDGIFDDRWQLD
jgi:hypothetical protein